MRCELGISRASAISAEEGERGEKSEVVAAVVARVRAYYDYACTPHCSTLKGGGSKINGRNVCALRKEVRAMGGMGRTDAPRPSA